MAYPCTKRKFPGEQAAKWAHRHASYRIRVYYCDECRAYHVTNNEKRHRSDGERDA